jgi:hypothetical protein
MLRSFAVGLSVCLITVVAWVGSADALAWTSGHGTSTCTVSVTTAFNPAAIVGGSGTLASWTLTSPAGGCTGPDFTKRKKHINGMTGTFTDALPAGLDCATSAFSPDGSLQVAALPNSSGTVIWQENGNAVASTHVTLTHMVESIADPIVSTSDASVTFKGVTPITGAFHNPRPQRPFFVGSFTAQQDNATVVADCQTVSGLTSETARGTLSLP